jgi:hypothetical protein
METSRQGWEEKASLVFNEVLDLEREQKECEERIEVIQYRINVALEEQRTIWESEAEPDICVWKEKIKKLKAEIKIKENEEEDCYKKAGW